MTNLFGQIKNENNPDSATFKGRIMPDNLVFSPPCGKTPANAVHKPEPLAVMGIPHPGCVPFYCNKDHSLRGYKVYRTSDHQSEADAPWRFDNQGVYETGKISDGKQNSNKTAELLRAGMTGLLRISFKSLSLEELRLLSAVCTVPWRLGGGKPLGLGLCKITSVKLLDEEGKILSNANGQPLYVNVLCQGVAKKIKDRLNIWKQSQIPVKNMRYPRSVARNGNNIQKMGATWFMKFAKTKYNPDGTYIGVNPINITGELVEQAKQYGFPAKGRDTASHVCPEESGS